MKNQSFLLNIAFGQKIVQSAKEVLEQFQQRFPLTKSFELLADAKKTETSWVKVNLNAVLVEEQNQNR